MYSELEEKDGLLNHAIEILDRMVANVPDGQKVDAYNLYIAKVANYLGITKTRPIFESAVENLKGDELVNMALRFSEVERKLGEIDRAR
jgi:pre-mRNA-splicing factor SYF1